MAVDTLRARAPTPPAATPLSRTAAASEGDASVVAAIAGAGAAAVTLASSRISQNGFERAPSLRPPPLACDDGDEGAPAAPAATAFAEASAAAAEASAAAEAWEASVREESSLREEGSSSMRA